MSERMPECPAPGEVSAAARALITELLRLPPEQTSRIRAQQSPRRRPRPQHGPSADFGTPAQE